MSNSSKTGAMVRRWAKPRAQKLKKGVQKLSPQKRAQNGAKAPGINVWVWVRYLFGW